MLIFAADPSDAARLRLNTEVAKIEQSLKASPHRDRFVVTVNHATQARDLRTRILSDRPAFVHFIGHGAGPAGLVLEDEQGNARMVSTDALAELFNLFKGVVTCVILNACYSEIQAKAIAEPISRVIGLPQAVGDAAAIDFSVGFYDALFAGETVARAFEFGKNAIRLESLADDARHALPARDIATPVADALPPDLAPVLLGTEPTAPTPEPGRPIAALVIAALVVAGALGLGADALFASSTRPDVTTVAGALRARYADVLASSVGAHGPQVNYRRLKAAVFKAYPACEGDPALLREAAQLLVTTVASPNDPNTADDLNLLAVDLPAILQSRLAWLEGEVMKALARSQPATVGLPAELRVNLMAPDTIVERFEDRGSVTKQITELRVAIDQFTRQTERP